MENLIEMPVGAQRIIQQLALCGYESYIVGGCVRDSLLGIRPSDWDICTAATPEEVKTCFPDKRIIDTGLKHGTITVIMGGMPYEVTTFRVDGDYSDNRRPDTVTFVRDLRADLARRDFTINAIAYNESRGIVDPYSGIDDLSRGTINCVGNPNDRFNEDALRILRALRFSSTYGFRIGEETTKAIHDNAGLLSRISAERIQAELLKLLKGENVLRVLLDFPDVITTIIPEMTSCVGFDQKNKYHQYTVYDHIAHAVDNYKGNDAIVKVALLLHDIGKPQCYTEDENGGHFHGHGVPSSEIAAQVLQRLRFDNESQKIITELVLYHDATIDPTPRVIKRWLNKIGFDQFLRLMDVRLADMQAHAINESRIKRRNEALDLAWELVRERQCFTLKDLAINGHDVMSLGVPEGKQVGTILLAALNAVLDGDIPNDKEILLEFAKKCK